MIIHIDMDAFFAAVEQRDDPALRGRPVIIGGDRTSRRGVVATASYEARRFGIHSAMPLSEALRRCPDGIYLRGDFHKYRSVHEQLVALWRQFTPTMQVVSIDEAFLDIRGCERLFGPADVMAAEIQAITSRKLGLSASLGVARNTLVAKVASDHAKPHGLTIVAPGGEAAFLAPKPLRALRGVGPVLAAKLHQLGLRTVADVARAEPEWLRRAMPSGADGLQAMARGEGSEQLSADTPRKQIGSEATFAYDTAELEYLAARLLAQAREVAGTLRRRGQVARRLTLKLRDRSFQTQTQGLSLQVPSDQDQDLYRAARQLLDRHWHGEPVRLIGIAVSDLGEQTRQLDLFADPDAARRRQIGHCLDAVSDRFGQSAITWAKTLIPGND
ncbi:MAG: DNA polymerase IV [Candidatus Sericytochromatia bacterium]|nr:DNA polymerase IV [Candidatus Sericytochromatia bacterium]